MLVFEYQCKLKFLKSINHKTIAEKINYFLDSVLAKDQEFLQYHENKGYKYYVTDAPWPIEKDGIYKEGKVYTLRIRTVKQELAEIPMLTFYVKEDSMDEPEEISMEELTAYDRNLGIGDQVIIGPDETLFPLDMAENLGMFDEIDPLSQISETDPRQWQMEWMDNYMDALEELEASNEQQNHKLL